MKLSNDQIRAIGDAALRSGNCDLAALARDAEASPCARAELSGQVQPCAECGEPVHDPAMVKAQAERIAAFPGVAPEQAPVGHVAHVDCDHPELGLAEGYKPSGLVLAL